MISSLLYLRARGRIRSIERSGGRPRAIQERQLLRMLARAAQTRFGREHGFAEIRSASEYLERVPPQDYAALRPYLERARDYSRDETWPGVPSCFSTTSGTTGGNKYLPHTPDSLRSSVRGGSDALSAYLMRAKDRSLLRGRIAFLGGSLALHHFESGMPWGDYTGILAAQSPSWIRRFRSPSAQVLALGDWETRLKRAAQELARVNVRLLLGVPSWGLILMDAVEAESGKTIRDAWPGWRGFIHSGMAFGPYAETYRKRVGTGVHFVDTYSATEGGMLAVQDRSDDSSMAVVLDRNVFFDFAPADDPDGPRVGIHEVEPDVPYLIGVTTEAGLWSYRIGDLVKFTQTRPPRIVFHGRREFFLNAFGEHVSQEELEGSIAAAASSCGCEVREFTVLPEFPDATGAQGRHLWIVEFAHPPPDLDAFARSIDEAIMQGNDDYASHRAGDMQLRPPQVRLVRSGGFYEWMKARGRPTVPRIVDRDLVRGLLPPTA